MSAQTLADLSAPLVALRLLSTECGHLPAPSVAVSTVYPDQLTLSFYDGHADFEAWREALAVPPDDVVHRVQGDGQTGVLDVHVAFAGARLRLISYADIPVSVAARALSEVGR
ncbi:hypothetical protein V1460_01310 [Streptomyces sp. SCSIO 30461]|uniref:hypothetical protein n=1 Tax=Streptomyces sp. SCSIO 30461 TaxID=3118085 RepID=UPI0030D59E8B